MRLRPTPEAFEEFARRHRDDAPLHPARWAEAEQLLRDAVRRLRRRLDGEAAA